MKINKLWNDYGLLGSLKLLYQFITSKFIFWNSRLIRRPIYIRGKHFIRISKGFTTGVGLRLEAYPKKNNSAIIEIGENCQLNDYVHIGAIEKIIIGNNVLIASKVFITDHNHGYYGNKDFNSPPDISPNNRTLYSEKVTIGDNVWLGEFVSILPGVEIGAGSIIGAMSVVTHNIPPNSIAVGIPAEVIKKYNSKTESWEKI